MKRIRVLIVEDSAVIRELLIHMVGLDARLELAAAVASAEEALGLLDTVEPDVISLDIRLPGMNGFQATREIMLRRPTPIVVISDPVQGEELNTTMRALQAGALTVLEKPVMATSQEYESAALRLCTQLVIMSQVQVVRQHLRKTRQLAALRTPAPLLARRVGRSGRGTWSYPGVLGIASSTGGPGALAELLNGLGSKFPLPVLVVQHITPNFVEGFAAWLGRVCPLAVEVAKGGEKLTAGTVYIAPADRHLCADGSTLRLNSDPLVSMQRPSGTVLLQSMARAFESDAIGVVLTGMGDDGAAGLLEIREAGGHTIAEHESTAVVYGMPKAAVDAGAVEECLPLPAIAPRLLKIASAMRELSAVESSSE